MAACSGRTRADVTSGGSDETEPSPGATSGAPTGGGVEAGAPGSAGATTATAGAATTATAGTTSSGGFGGAGGELNVTGDGGMETAGATPGPPSPGPCDIYREAGQPCVAAYSTVRRLSSAYTGPLYQVRSGSSNQNTGSGGQTHDITQTADGFADAATLASACAGTICTVSLLYDQSGQGSHLPVASAGIEAGGPDADQDDFEASATPTPLTVGGHLVHPLQMGARQAYRLARSGDGMPRSNEPQGIYLLADGTNAGVGCCWEFGNGPHNAKTFYDATALFYGSGVTVAGAGDGPWFMADFHLSLRSSGSEEVVIDPSNPSLGARFALGFLKTNASNFLLRVADASTASALTSASQGALPRPLYQDGGVLLGVSADNATASSGTFYEGAIVAGFPADDTELAVLRNIQAAGYGKTGG